MTNFTKDAEEWGNALNDASWEYIEAFRRHTRGEKMSGHHWNATKSIVRDVILKYAELVSRQDDASHLNMAASRTTSINKKE